MVQKFVTESKAKPTFATKLANHKELLEVPPGSARVRLSLMPQVLSDVVESGTSRVSARIKAIDELLVKGYEVHINFSPVVVVSGIQQHYIELFQEIDSTLSTVAKSQLKCEVIFLTHHEELHDKNLLWNPEAEELLWKPEWQEHKTTHRGDANVLRYHYAIKSKLVAWFKQMLSEHLPYCKIRYIF
jgi:DNA repair photolyase